MNPSDNTSSDDRRLGETWDDWDGTPQDTDTRAPAGLFLFLAGLWVGVVALLGAAGAWLAWPRVSAWNAEGVLPWVVGTLYVWLGAWWISVAAGSAGWKPARRTAAGLGGIAWTLTPVLVLGRLLRVNRDRLMHAYVLVHNRLESLPPIVREAPRLLVLLPRCLSREMFQALAALKRRYGFTQMTVGGGTEARRAISRFRPQGIVAVACERDLVSGLRDVRGKVPVLAFSNQRPEGPCKNTRVDLAAVEQAVKRFLGKPAAPDPPYAAKGGVSS